MSDTDTTTSSGTFTVCMAGPRQWHVEMYAAIAGDALLTLAYTRHECIDLAWRRFSVRDNQFEVHLVTVEVPEVRTKVPTLKWPPEPTFAQTLIADLMAKDEHAALAHQP